MSSQAKTFSVAGIGELLLDLLPGGAVMGGAAANFACVSKMLGARAEVVSAIGADAEGEVILRRLQELGMSATGITVDERHPTGTVNVEILAGGQPRYDIREGVAWDHIGASAHTRRLVVSADAVCFGSLAQRSPVSRMAIQNLVASTAESSLRVFDVNLRQSYYCRETLVSSLELANVVKMNDEELPVICDLLGISGSVPERISRLVSRFDLRLAAYTRGGQGSLLFSGGEWAAHDGIEIEICDTVGAGDAFTAVVTLGLLNGWGIGEISEAANEVAAQVCRQPGAIPQLSPAVLTGFSIVSERSESGHRPASATVAWNP